MHYGKLWISLLTAVLVLAVMLFWHLEPEAPVQTAEEALPMSVRVTSDGKTEQIACWKSGEGQYDVFLPSYADPGQTSISLKPGAEVSVNGQILSDGQDCSGFRIGEAYPLEYTEKGEVRSGTITFRRSGQVPSMFIEVQSGTMDYIHASKGNKESGRIRIYDADGTISFAGNLKAISGRGNSTWTMEKKPYSLTLAGEADLLGLGQAQRWVLLANGSDASQLRNKLVYDYAGDVGLAYSPGSEWVDLYLNGEYAGLYLLCERNEIHPQRVAMAEDNSFLVSMELGWRLEAQGYPFISTDQGFDLRVHHSSITETQLRQILQSAENAILAEDGMDPVTGKSWTELIDLDSWARKYLIEEIFGSVDAGGLSQFFYGDLETGIIYAGPVWDYDVSMGRSDAWQLVQPQAFFANRSRLRRGMDASWYQALWEKKEFSQRVVQLYREEFRPFLIIYLQENLQEYAHRIEDAAVLNQYRWGCEDAAEAAEKIGTYMRQRLEFLDSVWLEEEIWYAVLVDTNDGSNVACYAVRPGETLPQLPDISSVPDALGWYYRETDQPVDISQPVTEDLDIYCKREIWEDETEDFSADDISQTDKAPAAAFLLLLLAAVCGELLRQFPYIREKGRRKGRIAGIDAEKKL